MRKIEIKCWEVSAPDGGGMHDEHVAYAGSKTVADAIVAESRSWPRYAREISLQYVIVDSFDEYKALCTENAKEAALAKLTEADKIALGLSKL